MADGGGVEDREMRDLGEFTVESIVGPPQGVAGGVEVLPKIVAAGGLLVVAVEPLPGLQVECALGRNLEYCSPCLGRYLRKQI